MFSVVVRVLTHAQLNTLVRDIFPGGLMTLPPTPHTMVSKHISRTLFFLGSACPGPSDPAPYNVYGHMYEAPGRLMNRYMPKWMGSGGSCRNGNCSAYVSGISDTVYVCMYVCMYVCIHTHTHKHTHTVSRCVYVYYVCVCVYIYRHKPVLNLSIALT